MSCLSLTHWILFIKHTLYNDFTEVNLVLLHLKRYFKDVSSVGMHIILAFSLILLTSIRPEDFNRVLVFFEEVSSYISLKMLMSPQGRNSLYNSWINHLKVICLLLSLNMNCLYENLKLSRVRGWSTGRERLIFL